MLCRHSSVWYELFECCLVFISDVGAVAGRGSRASGTEWSREKQKSLTVGVMGRKFCEFIAGSRLLECARCSKPLTSIEQRHSANFVSSTGPAWLFHRVVNVNLSEAYSRVMITGRHLVNDVMCKFCGARLGWRYEYAVDGPQRYKEGKVILECAAFREVENTVDAQVISSVDRSIWDSEDSDHA